MASLWRVPCSCSLLLSTIPATPLSRLQHEPLLFGDNHSSGSRSNSNSNRKSSSSNNKLPRQQRREGFWHVLPAKTAKSLVVRDKMEQVRWDRGRRAAVEREEKKIKGQRNLPPELRTTIKTAGDPAAATTDKKDEETPDEVYVLALETDRGHRDAVSALRERHFKREKLRVGAHITLFHALPGPRMHEVWRELRKVVHGDDGTSGGGRRPIEPFKIHIEAGSSSLMPLRRGLALHVQGLEPAARIRRLLLGAFVRLGIPLTDQDRDRDWHGHYTIQNFVAAGKTRKQCERDALQLLSEDDDFGGSSGGDAVAGGAGGAEEAGSGNYVPGRNFLHTRRSLRNGTVMGLTLWLYDNDPDPQKRGRWLAPESVMFQHGIVAEHEVVERRQVIRTRSAGPDLSLKRVVEA
ncbi:2'-5' RNA ligase family protein [Microdochium nivale]|nr:2'-5' RNA ligase family protein [Microdochium nivale]